MANAHVEQGMDYYRAGRYDAAVLEFRKAREFVSSSALVWNMARAYEELGDIRNAVHYYEALVTEFPEDESSEEALERLERLRLKAPGSLVVECGNVRTGRVILDEDEDAGRDCDARFPSVSPGVHSVRVESPGRDPWLGNVRVAAGKRAFVEASWRSRGKRRRGAGRKAAPRAARGAFPWAAVALTTAAVVLFAGAAVFHLRSEGAVEDYDALHDRESVTATQVRARAESANSDATVAASMLAVGVLSGGVAAWAWSW